MDEAKMAALLGRPLTTVETDNFELYLGIARQFLDDLLCTTLCDTSNSKFFGTREGYRTVFIDPFQEIEEIKINGIVVDPSEYIVKQWDRRNASWYNSVVFDCRFNSCDDEIEVSAIWGFESGMPSDLQSVLAGLFDSITKKNKMDTSIQSKQVEDFRISFNTNVDLDAEFGNKYSSIIAKYSLCDIANVQHGKVC